jgi:iron complex outermembrane receptor protein
MGFFMPKFRFLPLLAIGVSLAPAAFAESLQLGATTVQAAPASDPTAPTQAEVRAEFAKIPGGASVIDSATYKTGRSSTPQDALGLATGVFVQPRFGAEESRLSIRGSGLNRTYHGRGLLLMQDGAPINLADGSFDFQTLEPLATEHIEVLRGANAWRYGNATLGGAINYVAPTGKSAAPVNLRAEGGSFGYQRSAAAVAQDFGNADSYLSASQFSQQGFREHAKQDSQRYFSNIGGRINEQLYTRLYLTHVESNSELPGSLTKTQMRQDAQQASASAVSGDQKRDLSINRIGNLTGLELGNGHRLELATYYTEKSLLHPIYQVLDIDSTDFGLRLTHRWDNTDGWAWQAGVDASKGRNFQNNYLNVGGEKGRQVDELHQTALNLNVFTELTAPLAEDWSLIGGLTWLNQTRDVDDQLQCNAFVTFMCIKQNDSFNQTYSGHIGRLGLLNNVSDELQLFTNISQSYEPPTFAEMTGGIIKAPNKAQTADTLEVGLRWQREHIDVDLAVYHSRVHDELLSLSDAKGNPLGTVNADQTVHQGIELGSTLTLGQFTLRGQYLLNDFRFDNDALYGDNPLPGMPSQFVKGELLWQQHGFYAGPTTEWVPSDYNVDMADTLDADSYAIWGFKVGYQMPTGIDLFIEGRNLSDKTYAATTGIVTHAAADLAKGKDPAVFMPGDGRAVFTGIEWRL